MTTVKPSERDSNAQSNQYSRRDEVPLSPKFNVDNGGDLYTPGMVLDGYASFGVIEKNKSSILSS